MGRDQQAILDGVVGGLIGTLGMSALLLAARRLGLVGQLPPERITEAALDTAGLQERPEQAQDALAVLAHFAFGGALGAPFVLLRRRLRLPGPPALQGAVYGSLVWAVSYKGWVPALGILPPPERDRPDRPAIMLLAHWLYGGILGAISGRRDNERG